MADGDDDKTDENKRTDPRMGHIMNYTLKSFKSRHDKWFKMTSQEENVLVMNHFLDKPEFRVLVIFQTSAGVLSPVNVFPDFIRHKMVYFVKRNAESIKEDNFKSNVLYGEMSTLPLEQLTTIVDQVVVPMVGNTRNHRLWPNVVSQDVLKHTGGLKGDVLVLSGKVQGKTFLPLPQQADLIENARMDEQEGHPLEKQVIHSIESIVIEWCHQVRDVLQKNSAQPLLNGQNPGPLVEIKFWKDRCEDLYFIREQLSVPKVKKMALLLGRTKSTYYPAFQRMLEDLEVGVVEAQDISMHLRPLRRMFENFEEMEYLELPKRFMSLFHVVALVWANSTHYRHPVRLVVLLQEICNMIIQLTNIFLQTEDLLRAEPEEGLEKVEDSIKTCHKFIKSYHDKKKDIARHFKEGVPVVEWDFNNDLIFARLNCYLERLSIVQDYFKTILEFLKLEKIQFGGSKGNCLVEMVGHVFSEFSELLKRFTFSSYDPMDLAADEFMKEYVYFKKSTEDLDRRLGNIVCIAFEDCSGTEGVFKMLDMMGSLLDRPVIYKFFQHNYLVVVQMCNSELDAAKVIYDKQRARAKTPEGPILGKNMPPVAGILRWCQQLRDRVNSFMDRLRILNNEIIKTPEAQTVFSKHDQMLRLIEEYEMETYKNWAADVNRVVEKNLVKPLLVRNEETLLLTMNFDPELVALLREVKYIEQRDSLEQPIPESAAEVFKKNEIYRKYIQSLDVIVSLYNKVWIWGLYCRDRGFLWNLDAWVNSEGRTPEVYPHDSSGQEETYHRNSRALGKSRGC